MQTLIFSTVVVGVLTYSASLYTRRRKRENMLNRLDTVLDNRLTDAAKILNAVEELDAFPSLENTLEKLARLSPSNLGVYPYTEFELRTKYVEGFLTPYAYDTIEVLKSTLNTPLFLERVLENEAQLNKEITTTLANYNREHTQQLHSEFPLDAMPVSASKHDSIFAGSIFGSLIELEQTIAEQHCFDKPKCHKLYVTAQEWTCYFDDHSFTTKTNIIVAVNPEFVTLNESIRKISFALQNNVSVDYPPLKSFIDTTVNDLENHLPKIPSLLLNLK